MKIEEILRKTNISGYLRPIETQKNWLSYRSPDFPINSASLLEQRFNRPGEIAYYIASGDMTAQQNVPDWQHKIRCRVAPQTIYCFDLPTFSRDQRIFDAYLKSKSQDGYPLSQETADFLLQNHGITGILYTSYADYIVGRDGCCIVIRPNDGKFVDETFFQTEKSNSTVTDEAHQFDR
jgi:hypothetical protein